MNSAFRQTGSNSIGDGISVFFGTAAESAIDMASFGLLQPDIIPQSQEEANPWATTGGRIAGSVAGFIGTTALTEAALIGTLGRFAFGRAVINAAKPVGAEMVAASKALPTILRGGAGAIHTGTVFAAQEAAREYIRQVKENDPDMYKLGKATFGQLVSGGIFGTVEKAFMYSAPAIQIVAGGSSFALADAYATMAEGGEITKEGIAKSMFIGMAMSGIAARGTEKRRAFANESAIARMNMIDDYVKNGGNQNEVFKKATGMNIKDLPKDIQDLFETLGKERPTPDKLFKVSGANPEAIARKERGVAFVSEGSMESGVSFVPATNEQKKTLHTIAKNVGLDIKGNPEHRRIYENAISTVSSGRAKSSTQLTEAEAEQVINEVSGYMSAQMGMKTRNPDILKNFRTPTDNFYFQGLSDFTHDVKDAHLMMMHLERGYSSVIDSIVDSYEQASKTSGLKKTLAVLKNEPTDAIKRFNKVLNIENEEQYLSALKEFNPAQQKAIKDYRALTDLFIERTNEVRVAIGLEPITKRAGYMTRIAIAERTDMKQRAPRGGGAFEFTRPRPQENPTALQRVDASDVKFIQDPRRMAKAMVKYDLKDMFLHRPIEILKAQLKVAVDSGLISSENADSVSGFIRTMQGYPTRTAAEWERSFGGIMSGTGLTKAINTILKPFNRTVGDKPLDWLSATFGRSATMSLLAGRPALAIRNSFQIFLDHGMVSTKNLAKGMVNETPEQLKKILSTSPAYRYSVENPEFFEGSSMSNIENAGMEMFTKSTVMTVDVSARSFYYEAMDYITDPKFAKLGWATSEGVAARAAEKAKGNKNWNNILSQEEISRVTKNVEYGIEHTQFLYHLSGMPGIMGNPVGRMAFKLQSYPINYFMSYLGEMKNRAVTGSPGWDTTGKLKLPAMQQFGILKHFIVLGAIAATAEEAGFNMSDIVGGYVSPIHDPSVKMTRENEAGQVVPRTGIDRIYNEVVAHKRIGTFSMRPSPSIAFLSAMKDMFSNEAYVRTKAQRQLEDLSIIPTGMIVPGGLAVRDILRAIEYEQPERIFLRKQMPRKTTKKTTGTGTAFSPIRPIQPFQPFTGGR